MASHDERPTRPHTRDADARTRRVSFPRYPSYRPSGVEWLGSVPSHWSISRLKRACDAFPSNVDKKSVTGETDVRLCNYTDVYYNDRIVASMDLMAATATADQIKRFTLRAGDTVITKDSETADDIAVGAFVPDDLPGVVCGYHLSIVRPRADTHGAFIKWFFDSAYARAAFEVRANGLTRVGLGQYELDNVDLALPAFEEQVAIAAFLDRETAKIDGLVAEQERLIELLKEKRQAVISHAVTKGLNPDAPMKPSGVEWLGDVPAHWRPVALKHCLERLVDTEHKTAPFVEDGQFLVVRTANVRDGRLVLEGAKFTDEAGFEEWTRRAVPQPGDIIFTREAPAGEACIVPERVPLCLGQRTVLMKIDRGQLEPAFGLWSLYGGLSQEFVRVLAQGSTVAHFNMSDIANVPLLLPPLSEQREIARFVGRALNDFDRLSTSCGRTVALLTERRTALVSAAVTGQVDVRGLN
jgi:type I restriction enzyme, S subunit